MTSASFHRMCIHCQYSTGIVFSSWNVAPCWRRNYLSTATTFCRCTVSSVMTPVVKRSLSDIGQCVSTLPDYLRQFQLFLTAVILCNSFIRKLTWDPRLVSRFATGLGTFDRNAWDRSGSQLVQEYLTEPWFHQVLFHRLKL